MRIYFNITTWAGWTIIIMRLQLILNHRTLDMQMPIDITPLQDMPPIRDLDDVDLLGLTPKSVNSSQEWLQRWL